MDGKIMLPIRPLQRGSSSEGALERIIESGMCIGCGLCASIAGRDVLRMGPGPGGEARPWALQEIPFDTQKRIQATCPANRSDMAPKDPDAPMYDKIWGNARRMAIGYANDEETRFVGSSGGGITALVEYLLASETVAFVLHVRESAPAPLLSSRQLSFEVADVLAGAGSRYGVASPLVDFEELLGRGEPFAVVGKPCDIAAVKNMAKIDPRVDELVKLTLSFFCGGFGARRIEHMLEREKIDRTTITRFRHRGHGCPGPTHLEFQDGSTRDYGFLEFWGEGEDSWGIPFRCKVCPDAIGEQADIVAFDVWEGASESGGESGNYSGFMARTEIGSRILMSAEAEDYVTLERETSFRELNEIQPHHLRRREGAAPRLLAVAVRSRLLMTTDWRRLLRLAMRKGPAHFVRNFTGGFRRASAERERMIYGTPPAEWSGLD